MSLRARSLFSLASALGIVVVVAGTLVVAAEPIKFGTSQSLTGGLAPLDKAMLLTEQMWVEQVNGRGGLLGRPIQLVFYDDRSSPATDPGIYTKSSMSVAPISCLETAPFRQFDHADPNPTRQNHYGDVRSRGERSL